MGAIIYRNDHGKEFSFNDLICIEMLMGVPDEKRIGRIVQVRKGVGAFGSDIYLIRLRDGSLVCFENVLMRRADDHLFEDAFYHMNGKNPPLIPEHTIINELDSPDEIYSIGTKWPEIGFVIEKPNQPESETQSFSMTILTK